MQFYSVLMALSFITAISAGPSAGDYGTRSPQNPVGEFKDIKWECAGGEKGFLSKSEDECLTCVKDDEPNQPNEPNEPNEPNKPKERMCMRVEDEPAPADCKNEKEKTKPGVKVHIGTENQLTLKAGSPCEFKRNPDDTVTVYKDNKKAQCHRCPHSDGADRIKIYGPGETPEQGCQKLTLKCGKKV